MDKTSIRKIAIDIAVLGIALTIGIVLKGKLAQQPIDYTHLPSTNWFIAIPFLLGLLFLVAMGYWTDKKINR